jgi:hypothetical protein
VWFGWKNRNLVTSGAKEGLVYLLDADALGGNDHQTTLFTSAKLGHDRNVCCEGLSIWGGLSTARDADGQTWLFVPMGGPPSIHAPKFAYTNGDNPRGSIMAFKVVADLRTQAPGLEPVWISRDFSLPDPVVIANGFVFALSTGENAQQERGRMPRPVCDPWDKDRAWHY